MRKFGQNPTKDELRALIDSVDSGERDGQIQLREFLELYAKGLDSQGTTKMSDVNDCFEHMGGDPCDKKSKVHAKHVHDVMLAEFELDVDFVQTFGLGVVEFTRDDFEGMLLDDGGAKNLRKRRSGVGLPRPPAYGA